MQFPIPGKIYHFLHHSLLFFTHNDLASIQSYPSLFIIIYFLRIVFRLPHLFGNISIIPLLACALTHRDLASMAILSQQFLPLSTILTRFSFFPDTYLSRFTPDPSPTSPPHTPGLRLNRTGLSTSETLYQS